MLSFLPIQPKGKPSASLVFNDILLFKLAGDKCIQNMLNVIISKLLFEHCIRIVSAKCKLLLMTIKYYIPNILKLKFIVCMSPL